jgi:hypothetical protein
MLIQTNSRTSANDRCPESGIGISKNLLKLDAERVYMRDGQEFMLMFKNPNQVSYLVKIKINGKYMSGNGLIVRPGQVVWLDCDWETRRKFVFSTYEVDANDADTAKAISNNGLVEFEFYRERTYQPTQQIIDVGVWPAYPIIQPVIRPYWQYPYYYSSPINICSSTGGSCNGVTTNNVNYSSTTGSGILSNGTVICSSFNAENSTLTSGSSNAFFTNCSNTSSVNIDSVISSKIEETGRIEQGDKSNQGFIHSNEQFDSVYSYYRSYKILPESKKNVTAADLFKCKNCGKKFKKNDKFCRNCGEKI